MANRADRRKAKKNAPRKSRYQRLSPEQKLDHFYKNGITIADLQKAYDEGRHDALQERVTPLFQTFYSALCLALNEKHGFGSQRCYEVLMLTDHHIAQTLTSLEIAQEVLERLGLEIDMYSPEGHVIYRPEKKGKKTALTGQIAEL